MSYQIQTTTSTSQMNTVGYEFPLGSGVSSDAKIAQSFTTVGAGTLTFTSAYIGKSGSPADNTTIGIQADSSGVPSGTFLTSQTIASSTFNASGATVSLSMATIEVTATTQYWVVIERSGAYAQNGADTYGSSSSASGLHYIFQNSVGTWGSDQVATFNCILDISSTTVYTLSTIVGAFTLTGIDLILSYIRTMIANVGQFILTGFDVILTKTGWNNQTKSSTTFANQTKNTTTFTNQTKNTTSFTNQTKN